MAAQNKKSKGTYMVLYTLNNYLAIGRQEGSILLEETVIH